MKTNRTIEFKKILSLFFIFAMLICITVPLGGCSSKNNEEEYEEDEEQETKKKKKKKDKDEDEKEPEEEHFDWKSAYVDYLKENEKDIYPNYALICLDDDNIPELFIDQGATSSSLTIATCYKGKVSDCDGLSAYSKYMEKDGIICSETGQMGNYPLSIIKLEKGKFKEIASGGSGESYDNDKDEYVSHYYWGKNEKEVSYEEYKDKIAEYIDESKCKTPEYTSYNGLCEMLNEWPDDNGADKKEAKHGESDDMLLEYAQNLEYISGMVGYFDSHIYTDQYGYPSYEKDYSEVPFGNIDCFIDDYDRDGDEELLIADISNDKGLTLSMYECKGGNVELSDTFENYALGNDSVRIDVISYDYDDKIIIGVVCRDSVYIMADGVDKEYKGITYDGNRFSELGNAWFVGSDPSEEDEAFMNEMHKCGVYVDWDDCWDRNFTDVIMEATRGSKLLSIEDIINDYVYSYDDGPYTTYTRIAGYVRCTGFSDYYFTKHDGPDPAYDYVIPDSSIKELTDSDLALLNNDQLRIARNEIAAKHGRRFKDEELQAYFDSKGWYKGTIEPDDFDAAKELTKTERNNMDFIMKHEK